MLSLKKFPQEKVRLVATTISQDWQHIGHHCCCYDQQLNRDLLHGITSFGMDLLDERIRSKRLETSRINIKMSADGEGSALSWVEVPNLLTLKMFSKRGPLASESDRSKVLLTIAYGKP